MGQETGSPRRHFSLRGLVTALLLISFCVMVFSGIVAFVAPSGRVSRLVDWQLVGLDRVDWQSIHVSFAVLFVAFGLVHLGFNWRGLLHRLREPARRGFTIKREAMVALAVSVGLLVSALAGLPPISTLHDLNQYFRTQYWVDQPDKPVRAEPGSSLPSGHPPVPADKACSDCHGR